MITPSAKPVLSVALLLAPIAASAAPAATPAYTLADCLRRAVSRPIVTKQAQLSEDIVARDIKVAKAATRPLITTNINARTSTVSDAGNTGGSGDYSLGRQRLFLGINANYTLYDAGRNRDGVKIAEQRLRQTKDASTIARLAVLDQTTTAYFALLQAQRRVPTGQATLAAAQELLRASQTRLELGQVTQGDVLTAQSALASAQAGTQNNQRDVSLAQTALVRLIGDNPLTTRPTVTEPEAGPDVSATAEDLIARQLQADPNLDLLSSQKIAARNRLSQIRAERSPSVNIGVGVGFITRSTNNNNGSRERSNLDASLNLGLTVPLFESTAIKEREQQQIDELQLRDLAIDDYKNGVGAQIVAELTRYQSLTANIDTARAAVSAAQQARTLAEGRYEAGTGTQQEVLNSLRVLSATQDALANTLNERDIAARNLRVVSGLEDLSPYLGAAGVSTPGSISTPGAAAPAGGGISAPPTVNFPPSSGAPVPGR